MFNKADFGQQANIAPPKARGAAGTTDGGGFGSSRNGSGSMQSGSGAGAGAGTGRGAGRGSAAGRGGGRGGGGAGGGGRQVGGGGRIANKPPTGAQNQDSRHDQSQVSKQGLVVDTTSQHSK